jgi:hypothetical protein
MRTIVVVAIAGFLAAGGGVFGQEASPPTLSTAPRVLLGQIRADQTIEQFIATVMAPMRRYGRDHGSLDVADITRFERVLRAEARAKRVAAVLASDLDLDGSVTRAEVLESLRARQTGAVPAETLGSLADEILKLDRDGNGVIEPSELLASPPTLTASETARVSRLRGLVALGPAHANRVTAAELAAQAWQAFKAADTNGDGIIDAAEAQSAARAATSFRLRPQARS